MNDLIEKIGPFLGIAAFLGLAILAFLIFQQAREVRRLRDWAGRAPERAADAAEASLAAAEARGETVEEEEEPSEPREPGRLRRWWQGARARASALYAGLDRRMPVDPRYLLAVLAAGVVAAAVLTSGFGFVGGDDDDDGAGRGTGGKQNEEKLEVAVLNATQEEAVTGDSIAGVPGLADKVAKEVVKPAGYKVGEETDAASGLPETVIMFESADGGGGANEQEAEKLAAAVADQLGETQVAPMVDEVRDLAGGAELALVVGADDAEF